MDDRLTLKRFNSGTKGFVDPAEPDVLVCLQPQTELLFRKAPIDDERLYCLTPGMKVTFVERDLAEGKTDGYQDALDFHNGAKWTPALLQELSDGFEVQVLCVSKEDTMGGGVDFDDTADSPNSIVVKSDHITDEVEAFANAT
jgi:hypothetical protein